MAAVDKQNWTGVLICKQSGGSYSVFVEKYSYSTLGAAKKAASLILTEYEKEGCIRPAKLMVDGTKYIVLYGDDLMSGCAGFGDTPNAAMRDFDRQWLERKPPVCR